MGQTYLTVGDVHIADRAFGSRIDDYCETTFRKLGEIGNYALKVRANAVLFTGDIFHWKEKSKNSHNLVRRLIDTFTNYPCPVYVIPGNHDMVWDRPESIPEQPLGVILASGAMVEVTPEGTLIESGGLRVRIAGTDYDEKEPMPNCGAVKKQADDDVLITIGHFYAGPEGGDFFGHRRVAYKELYPCETDIWVLGHFHIDQGITDIEEAGVRRTFINIGSLTRGTLDEDNIQRIPCFSRIDIADDGTWETEKIPIPGILPADEVFSLVKYEERKLEKAAIKEFIQNLGENIDSNGFSLEDMKEFLGTLGIESEVEKIVRKYIEEAEHGV